MKKYNTTSGDGGDKSEETRAKLSAAAKARSPETVAKHSEAMSRANKGRLVSAATRAKISASQMGHKGGKKAIIATDKGGNKRKFESLAGAARILSDENGELFRPNSISRCCLKKVIVKIMIVNHAKSFESILRHKGTGNATNP